MTSLAAPSIRRPPLKGAPLGDGTEPAGPLITLLGVFGVREPPPVHLESQPLITAGGRGREGGGTAGNAAARENSARGWLTPSRGPDEVGDEPWSRSAARPAPPQRSATGPTAPWVCWREASGSGAAGSFDWHADRERTVRRLRASSRPSSPRVPQTRAEPSPPEAPEARSSRAAIYDEAAAHRMRTPRQSSSGSSRCECSRNPRPARDLT
jgi:hypothetical protein